MLEGLRFSAGNALVAFANRLTRETRYVQQDRVPYSPRTLAGVPVTPDTAVCIPAVWACLRYLSQTTAALPWRVMQEKDRGVEVARSHPVDYLIARRPNPEWSSFQFRETLVHWALRWGNGYAEIERDSLGRPIALWPIHPERVTVCRDPDTRELYYEVDAEKIEIAARDMFHIRGFGEGPVGVNVITYAAQSLGWARASALFGAAFFGNGAMPATVVVNKKALSPEGKRRQREEFDQLHKGAGRSHRVAITDLDADIKVLDFDARKSQLIELNQFLVEEICRWFGVPPHKIMHLLRATFSNIEHQAIEVQQDSIMPWTKRFEDEADYKLFGVQNRLRFYTKINMRGLLRGDFKAQNEGFEIMRRNGALNADEWREYLDMNRMPNGEGGDKYVMQSQYTTLERIGEEPTTDPSADPNADPNAPPDDPLAEDETAAAARARVESMMLTYQPAGT